MVGQYSSINPPKVIAQGLACLAWLVQFERGLFLLGSCINESIMLSSLSFVHFRGCECEIGVVIDLTFYSIQSTVLQHREYTPKDS